PRRSLRVDLDQPLSKLLEKILLVQEPPLLEERSLDPLHQILDGALLLGAVGPTQLDPQPQVERHPRKCRVPLRHLSITPPGLRDRLRAIEHGQERNASAR